MIAARGWPEPSTSTSTMRPMSSSAALRISLPTMLCTSLEPSTVTEGCPGGSGFCGFCARAICRGVAGRVTASTTSAIHPVLSLIARPPLTSTRMRQAGSLDDRNLDSSLGPQDLERDVVAMAAELDVSARPPELKIAQRHLVEKCRQPRLTQANLAPAWIELQPKCRLEQ